MKHLRLRDRWGWQGVMTFTHLYADGARFTVVRPNLITNAGYNLLSAALLGTGGQEILWLAWGDDATAPNVTDTSLGNELGRKEVTSQSIGGGVGETVTTWYLAPGDANEAIEEVGVYAGGSAAADSGTLIARVLYSHEKNDGEAILVTRTDTLGP